MGSDCRLQPTAGFMTPSLHADSLETTIISAPCDCLSVVHLYFHLYLYLDGVTPDPLIIVMFTCLLYYETLLLIGNIKLYAGLSVCLFVGLSLCHIPAPNSRLSDL